ncbi:ribonuclease D [Cellulomonas sp. P24]|uniref:ribonuclease D n=1 Tax=Cellulomonas sp. P24 TaxID=2885206 RepID=UPI00216AE14E|nr:ribonuclease D [Cellulomonas sp. P24]MCR6492723.1 ribonuclease D [Cellulomonas sp. P24]
MVTLAEGDLPDELLRRFLSSGVVGWDTETGGLDWRTDRLALCQLHAPQVGTVLVRMTDQRPQSLARLLADPDVTKVFHHAPFDLRFMHRAWGVRASNVRCTKVASKLLSPSAPAGEHSLAALVDRHLAVALEKGAERVSDWSAPELSREQMRYAARDVEFLLPLLDVLEAQLGANGLASLYAECCAFLPAQVETSILGLDDVFAY